MRVVEELHCKGKVNSFTIVWLVVLFTFVTRFLYLGQIIFLLFYLSFGGLLIIYLILLILSIVEVEIKKFTGQPCRAANDSVDVSSAIAILDTCRMKFILVDGGAALF